MLTFPERGTLQMWLRLRILKWGEYPALSRGLNITTRVLNSKRGKQKNESERCDIYRTWSTIAGSEDGRRGHGRGICWCLEVGNGLQFSSSKTGTLTLRSQEVLPTTRMSRKHTFPSSLRKSTQPFWHLDVSLGRPLWTSYLRYGKIIYLCYLSHKFVVILLWQQ